MKYIKKYTENYSANYLTIDDIKIAKTNKDSDELNNEYYSSKFELDKRYTKEFENNSKVYKIVDLVHVDTDKSAGYAIFDNDENLFYTHFVKNSDGYGIDAKNNLVIVFLKNGGKEDIDMNKIINDIQTEEFDENDTSYYKDCIPFLKKVNNGIHRTEVVLWFNENDIDYFNMSDLEMYIYYIEKNLK
jgi:hypothetical protein